MGGPAGGEGVEGNLGSCVFGLAEGGVVMGVVEGFAVEVDDGLEPGRVVGTFPDAGVGRQIKTASLSQLL